MSADAERARVCWAVSRAGHWLAWLYGLEIGDDPAHYLLSREGAMRWLDGAGPRSAVLVREGAGALELGIYLDPSDARDPGTVVEETGHWLCLCWHAARDLPVSALVLELQGEVDRYAWARFRGGDPLAHFERFRWAAWTDRRPAERARYETAHRHAARYCRELERRFPSRRDRPGLVAELRRFYRASPQAKLRCGRVGCAGAS